MENNKHFLEWITVEEFKCFSNFHAEGFKRVNLIGGKNNVGKTALMEAMYINVCSASVETMTTAIRNIKSAREFINDGHSVADEETSNAYSVNLLENTKSYKSRSNVIESLFLVKNEHGIKEYLMRISQIVIKINARDFSYNHQFPIGVINITSDGLSDDEVNYVFDFIQRGDGELILNKFLNEFDDNIRNFKIIGGKPQCKVNDIYRDLTEFGDGLRSYISIICSFYACKNGYLFIDEIDNGIYYEHFDRLWEIILTLSKEMSCQVFATTHSKEMLESFARVAKKLEEQDVSYTTLVRNKSNELKAITRDYEMLMDSMEDGREVR